MRVCVHAHVCVVWLVVLFVFSDTWREALVWVCRDGKGPVGGIPPFPVTFAARAQPRCRPPALSTFCVLFCLKWPPLPWSQRPVSVCLSVFSPSLICLPLFAPLESLFRKPLPGPSVLNHYFVYFPRRFPTQEPAPCLVACLLYVVCVWRSESPLSSEAPTGSWQSL